jgi:sialate O-acetylesterase
MSLKNLSLAFVVALSAASLCADVTPAVLFQSHSVLQQGRLIPVWGTADAGEKVTVSYSAGAMNRTASAVAGADGRWYVELPALAASAQPATLTFSGKNTVTREDVLVGEVWLASGQSNMEWVIGAGKRVNNFQEEIAAGDFPLIREIRIRKSATDTPQDTVGGTWRACHPSVVSGFSATGYFFARDLHRKLNVPVGIIAAAWGGSTIEPFITPAALAADPNGPAALADWKTKIAGYPENKARYEGALAKWTAAKTAAEKSGSKFTDQAPSPPYGPGHQATPSGSYNAMIHPLVPYAIRGVIWYQGESNVGRHAQYRTFFPSLIAGWREVFRQPELPFYWVQLPNYSPKGEPNGQAFAWLRDAQDRTLSVPHTGQVVAIDIGDSNNIHPGNKQDVGHRLARVALRRTYGQKDMIDSGPTLDRVELNAGSKNRIRVHFTNVAGGLMNANPDEQASVLGFEVAGADRNFHAAEVRVENPVTGTVLIAVPATVPVPTYVRYAFRDDPKNTLRNSEGLPAVPFHTDL